MIDPERIARTMIQRARERGVSKSTCPSEIARELFPKDWRTHMREIRDVAILLYKSGMVLLTQKGKPIAPNHIKGPIRIKINTLS